MKINSVLIVDDSEGDHFIIEIVIKDFDDNIEIFNAYDGTEALEIIKDLKEHPSLILLDINMPLMDGFEFLEHYKKMQHSNVVVMLSSSNHEQDRVRAFSYPQVKSYLIKPLEVAELQKIASL